MLMRVLDCVIVKSQKEFDLITRINIINAIDCIVLIVILKQNKKS